MGAGAVQPALSVTSVACGVGPLPTMAVGALAQGGPPRLAVAVTRLEGVWTKVCGSCLWHAGAEGRAGVSVP